VAMQLVTYTLGCARYCSSHPPSVCS